MKILSFHIISDKKLKKRLDSAREAQRVLSNVVVWMGKGSWRRPRQVSREELDLRYEYGEGKMSLNRFNRRLKEIRWVKKNDRRTKTAIT